MKLLASHDLLPLLAAFPQRLRRDDVESVSVSAGFPGSRTLPSAR